MLLTLLVVVLLIGLGPVLVVQAVGQSHVVASLDDVPATDVVVVPGAGLRPDGTPSVYLTRRLEAAKALYDAGTVRAILVSGDNRSASHDEPTAMRDWLVAHDVPDDAIVRDFAGLDTHDTCVRAKRIFGVERAVVVTQDYHLRRALFSCTAAGIDVVGVGVSSQSETPRRALGWKLREVPASWKAALDALTSRDPVHLGPIETSVADILGPS